MPEEKEKSEIVGGFAEYIGGTGRLRLELANGKFASMTCDISEPPVESQAGTKAEEVKPPQGKLPEGFPGLKALADAGITTFGQVRKERESHDQSLAHIKGIAEQTDLAITQALEVSATSGADEGD